MNIDYFTLPNILVGREIQKELLQSEVTGRNIYEEARRYYAAPGFRQEVVNGLQEAVAKLGEPGAAKRVAGKILAAAKKYSKSRAC